ncbi:MAG: hypothetical protein ACUZ8O_01220 [Candidatus Anammoxibacter sp.]
MRFWRKKHKKSKSAADEESTSSDSDETQEEPDTDENSSDTPASEQEGIKTETANGEENEITEPQGETVDDLSIEAESESEPDDTTETSITSTDSSVEETDLSETESDEPDVSDKNYEDTQSGVFIFGKKIEGRFQKVFFGILAITLIPPTFLFSIALLVCITLLIFPLITVIIIATFPATIFSFFILMAVLPVLFPAILIFLLITGKGRLSVFAEGKLLILKVFRWTLPTI